MMFEPASFFKNLGLLPRPLFAPHVTPRTAANVSLERDGDLILLDGVTASFALSRVERQPDDDEHYYDWSWSSHVTHHVEIDEHREGTGIVFVRRWDNPRAIRRFTLRSVLKYGPDFISALEQAGPSRGSSAINRALVLLRQLREAMAHSSQANACIKVFHTLLLGTAKARLAQTELRRRWLDAKTLGEATDVFAIPNVSDDLKDIRLYSMQGAFLERDPASGRSLDPQLLLRHAAVQLYEEAHRELDRVKAQTSFDFFTPAGTALTHKTSSVIFFTPSGLARVMAELAWRFYRKEKNVNSTRDVTVLDPACGSGSFLLESYLCNVDLPELHKLTLRGLDVSSRAIEMTSLALGDAMQDGAPLPTVTLEAGDALAADWGQADIVLMNPPFIAWNDLSEQQKESVKRICGSDGRPDLAAAFIIRAIDCLAEGGVMAAVLPSSLLSASSTESLRRIISQKTDIRVIGRFRGNDIFPSALIEPSIIIVQRKPDVGSRPRYPTTMLLSSPGSSDAALRALRRGTLLPADTGRYELYEVSLPPVDALNEAPNETKNSRIASSWLPRPQLLRELILTFEASPLPRVADLFSVKQGIRSGANQVFIVPAAMVQSMPERNQKYFRPLAGNKTIEGGKIEWEESIFYPYDKSGLVLTTEAELKRAVSSYYASILVPAKDMLKARAGIGEAWWEPTRPRNWQYVRRPKLVSSYFGRIGKFAFDSTGEFVVGQGFGWILEDKNLTRVQKAGKKPIKADDVTREVGPAYVALFNSRRFSQILSYYTYRVMGGQFDLSPRFVNSIPVPDLISPGAVPSDIVTELRDIGAKMGRGEWSENIERLDDLVAQAYGTTSSSWPIDIE